MIRKLKDKNFIQKTNGFGKNYPLSILSFNCLVIPLI